MILRLVIVLSGLLSIPLRALAANPLVDFLKQAGGQAYYGSPEAAEPPHPATIIGGVIQQILLVSGIILFMIFIYAGIVWLTGGGSEERITKAKNLLQNAFWGMLVTGSAYVLAHFITKAIFGAVTGTASV